MKPLKINGVNVKFPFEPYPCQLDYMGKVIETLDTSSNALLESPTGTGKTLCLLAASLAWGEKNKKSPQKKVAIKYEHESGSSAKPTPPAVLSTSGSQQPSPGSTIIYASRTHSQLSQVIAELNASGYSPKMTVLGSREQLCIHEKISKLKGAALNHACSTSGAQHKCTYKNNLEGYTSAVGILDIEELAELGREDKVCPYFLSRQNATSSELILLPYNYLIDASIRATLKIEWNDAIVILDEAHNLEKIASDAASFTISSSEIAACIKELQNVIKLLQLQEGSNPGGKSNNDKPSGQFGASEIGRKPSLHQCATILKALFDLESHIDRVPVSSTSGGVKMTGNAKCAVLSAKWFIDILQNVGFNTLTAPHSITEIRVCADFLMDDANAMLGSSSFGVGGGGSAVPEPKLVKLATSLSKVFKSTKRNPRQNQLNYADYRVFLKEEIQDKQSSVYATARAGGVNSNKGRVLHYWCFSPGVAMEDLKSLGVRSLILTSGTLSPMDAFKEDMKVPFAVELENPHVIDSNQIWISALPTGPSGGQLLSTYDKRDTNEYKDELGKSILSICQNMLGGHMNDGSVHPKLDGGVLVFFPSYGTMTTASSRWKESGLWAQLRQVMGEVVAETQSKSGVGYDNKGNNNYGMRAANYNRNEKWTSGNKQLQYNKDSFQNAKQMNSAEKDNDKILVANIIQEFEIALSSHGKCLLLAVCRGKVSEGIDFKDNKGRVAIMTGIPFSPMMDPWIVLKKQYLDDSCKQKGLFFATTPTCLEKQKKNTTSVTEEYKPPLHYQPSTLHKPSSLILGGTLQTISSGQASSKTKTAHQQRLSGQAWYVQSACRAVNQALGRVIRHKHDWGAVFLLDSRFQRSDQQQQLSGWIRPRISKHPNFSTALLSFRSFCTAALNNKSLEVKKENNEPFNRKYRKPFVPPSSSKHEDNIQRSVVVKSSSLLNSASGNEDVNYINPSLALSQNSILKEGEQIKSNAGFAITKSTNTRARSAPQSASDSNSMSKMFTMIKKSHSQIPSHSHTVQGGNTIPQRTNVVPYKPPTGNRTANGLTKTMYFSDDKKGCGMSSGSMGQLTKPNKEHTSRNAFVTAPKASGLQNNDLFTTDSVNTQTLTDSQTRKDNSGAFFNMTTVKSSTKLAEKTRKAEGKIKFKALVGKLETKLKPACFEKFVGEIRKVAALSKESGGKIDSISEVKSFVNSILNILVPVLSLKFLSEVVDVLSSLFQEKHLGIYNSAAKNTIKQLSHTPSSTTQSVHNRKKTSVHEDTSSNFSVRTTNSSIAQVGESSTSDSLDKRKRGHQLLSQICDSPVTSCPATEKAPKSDIFSALKTINIKKMERIGDNESFTQEEKVKKAKLDCIICSSPPKTPLINDCGHICCESCWESWLKVQRTCPLCRTETHKSNLSRLILK